MLNVWQGLLREGSMQHSKDGVTDLLVVFGDMAVLFPLVLYTHQYSWLVQWNYKTYRLDSLALDLTMDLTATWKFTSCLMIFICLTFAQECAYVFHAAGIFSGVLVCLWCVELSYVMVDLLGFLQQVECHYSVVVLKNDKNANVIWCIGDRQIGLLCLLQDGALVCYVSENSVNPLNLQLPLAADLQP